jgi:ketosteroid isomerase-like protein
VNVRSADAFEWRKKMTLDHQRARRFAETWYAAWNSHDLAAILDHYADGVKMASPLVSKLAGREDGRIAGKDALSTYFAAGPKRIPRSTSSLARGKPV